MSITVDSSAGLGATWLPWQTFDCDPTLTFTQEISFRLERALSVPFYEAFHRKRSSQLSLHKLDVAADVDGGR